MRMSTIGGVPLPSWLVYCLTFVSVFAAGVASKHVAGLLPGLGDFVQRFLVWVQPDLTEAHLHQFPASPCWGLLLLLLAARVVTAPLLLSAVSRVAATYDGRAHRAILRLHLMDAVFLLLVVPMTGEACLDRQFAESGSLVFLFCSGLAVVFSCFAPFAPMVPTRGVEPVYVRGVGLGLLGLPLLVYVPLIGGLTVASTHYPILLWPAILPRSILDFLVTASFLTPLRRDGSRK